MAQQSGTVRLFRFLQIDVFVHWSWAVVALIELQWRSARYSSLLWNAAEYLALFGIVLLHEYGHALACRSVGGRAERILLWPLGGVAYVQPPQRPLPQLWSIAAGPLVNLVLVPVTVALAFLAQGWSPDSPLSEFSQALAIINLGLLIFNLLPIYPLDGGQILRSVLWLGLGRGRSLQVAAVIGFFAAAAGGIASVAWLGSYWLGLIAAWSAWQSWGGIRQGRAIAEIDALPRQKLARCPRCGEAPPAGALWRCPEGHLFDVYAEQGRCPTCAVQADLSTCFSCGETSPIPDYLSRPAHAG